MNYFSERLKEERERMGLSQAALGELCGVKKLAQFNYEKGERSPDAAYLVALSAAGADVAYILTGHRSTPVLRAEEVRAGYSVEVLSKDEQALLDNYRHTPEDKQAAIREVGAALAQSGGGKKRAG